MNTIYIEVKNQFDDIHCYPNAPDEVSYLRNQHRHTFLISSKIQVFHEDRELEFYMVKDLIDKQIQQIKLLKDSKSCENIATNILEFLKSIYGSNRAITVSCSEDGWNKAIVEYKCH